MAACLVALLQGCAADERTNPVARHFGWFGTVQAGDVRAACADGRERYRFIYNGRYQEQLRVYDIVGQPDGGAAMTVQVRNPPNAAIVSIQDPLGPWRGELRETRLAAADLARLRAAVEASAVGRDVEAGLRLPSDRFYWLAAVCRERQFRYDGFLHPSPRFARLRFPEVLLALDPSGLPLNPPVPVPASDHSRDAGTSTIYFELTLGRDGLVSMPRLF